jgi:hypothetical protein
MPKKIHCQWLTCHGLVNLNEVFMEIHNRLASVNVDLGQPVAIQFFRLLYL